MNVPHAPRPACGTLQKLSSEGQPCGLRLSDLAQLRSRHDGDPFQALLHALNHGTIVVFDVETTGLSPAEDEVIDLGAVKFVAGRPAGSLEAFLRPARPLGG
jgi:DNA polymerase III epsilon subunit-like protein